MMQTFTEQQQKAKSLPQRLLSSKSGGTLRIFAPPILHSNDYRYACLIKNIGSCLDDYPVENENQKFRALLGMSIYVLNDLKKDSGYFHQPPLIDLLRQDWDFLKNEPYSPEVVNMCYKDLQLFIEWIETSSQQPGPKAAELSGLLGSFPDDLQLRIHEQLYPVDVHVKAADKSFFS